MAARKPSMKPKIETPAVALKAPRGAETRDAEYREYDGVTPVSGKDRFSNGFIPACVFGKQQKLAESCKVKLFFAGPEAIKELEKATGRAHDPGAYLRVCGPKTNDRVEVIPAGDVATGMKRAESVCGCVSEAGADAAACVTKASGLSGAPKKRRSRRGKL